MNFFFIFKAGKIISSYCLCFKLYFSWYRNGYSWFFFVYIYMENLIPSLLLQAVHPQCWSDILSGNIKLGLILLSNQTLYLFIGESYPFLFKVITDRFWLNMAILFRVFWLFCSPLVSFSLSLPCDLIIFRSSNDLKSFDTLSPLSFVCLLKVLLCGYHEAYMKHPTVISLF